MDKRLFFGTRLINYQKKEIMPKSSKENEKWGFEMQLGVASIFREKKKNEISTKKYTVFISNNEFWMTIIFVIIMLSIYIILEFRVDRLRNDFDDKINNQKTTKGGTHLNEELNNIVWKDLDVGDIVYLEKDEICPADLVILDTSEIYEREAICYVDNSALDGSISLIKKKAANISQIINRLPSKNNYKEFRKGLSGKIEYQSPNSNINEFFGYFRLKKDPKVETLTIDNFIPRGATIKYAEWVFGLIVYTGNDTKIMLNSNYHRYKISYIEYLTQIYFIFSGLVVFFFAIIHTIAAIARVKAYGLLDSSNTSTIQITKNILTGTITVNSKPILVDPFAALQKADPNIDDTSRIIIYLLLYSPLIPIFLYGFLDIINYLQKILIEYRIKREFKGEICKILDPMPFVNIATSRYALIDKTGTLTTSNYRINQIFFNGKVYKMRIDPKSIMENISEQDKIKYFSSPFKNTTSKGEILFANGLLNSTTVKDLSIISQTSNDMKTMKKFLSKIEESQLDLEDISVHSDQEVINEIKENNVFTFKRNIEPIDEFLTYDENDDIKNQKRSTNDIVRRLLGQESSNFNASKKIEIQLPKIILQTQEINSTNRNLLKGYDSLNNSINNNNDNSQISFRHKEESLKGDESFPLKKSMQSPENSNRASPEQNQFTHLYHSEREFLKDLLNINSDQNLDSLFEALTLCHSARSQLNSTKIICGRREDEVVLDFSRKCYFVFDKTDNPENPSQYYFKYKTQRLVYNIFGINEFNPHKKSFSIVYKSPINEELFLLCKGEEDYMRGLLLMTKKELEIYDFLIKDMQNQGLKPIVYARKPLTASETQAYSNKMHNLRTSLINQTEELNSLGKSMEFQLELLLIIGLKDELTEGAEDIIDFFNEIGYNIWMVTGDCKENAISTAFATKICNPMVQKCREIVQEDEATLNVVIRNYLIDLKNVYNSIKIQIQSESDRKTTNVDENEKFNNKLSKQMSTYLMRLRSERNTPVLQTQNQRIFSELRKKMQGVYLLINGKSLEIIFKDSFLKAHFVFLISFIKNVVCYNLTPKMKASLVSMIQNEFVFNPSVLAIGDNYNDVLMLQKADIGIELIKRKPLENRINAGDIQISSLKLVKHLMIFEGVRRLILQENLTFFMFYQSFLMGITIFFFYWFCILPLYRLYYTLLIFFYFMIFSTPNIIILSLFDVPVSEGILKVFPALYCEGLLKKRFIARRFILKAVIDALLHSLLIFYLEFYGITRSASPEGLTGGLNTFSITILITLILVCNLKIMAKCIANKNPLTFITTLITFVLMAFYVLVAVEDEPSWSNWTCDILFVFSNIAGIMLIIGVVMICLTLSYFMEFYIYKKFSPSLFDIFADIKKSGEWTDFSNEEIVNYIETPSEIGSYVKDIFSNVESLDPTIQEMFTPADINVNEIELNKYTLQIQQKTTENKYNFLTKKDHTQKASTIILLLIMIYGVFTITILILRDNKDYGYISLGIFILIFSLWWLTLTDGFKKRYYGLTKIFMLLGVMAKLAMDWVGNPVYISLGAILVPHITTINLNLGIVFVFCLNGAYFVSYFVNLLLIYYGLYPYNLAIDDMVFEVVSEFSNTIIIFYSTWNFVIFLAVINIVCFYGLYKFEKLKRSEFLAKSRIEGEANNVQDILAILVPRFVKDRLTQGETTMQEAQDDVGILFCDICDFDKVINSEGTKIVEILDEIFRNFDHLCLKHGIQKIETVGKTYMACAGLSSCEIHFSSQILKTEKTRRLVSMALEMVKYIQNITYGKGEHIKLKIGIHNGRVISGVIGYHKPQFSLIGDTVNTTSRVCSTGIDGSITLSEEAFENIKNSNIECEQRVVQAKGKGDLITYQVLNQKKIKKHKESKLKRKINEHMPEIRNYYEKLKAENKKNQINSVTNTNQAATYNKAVNLMSTWLVSKKIELKEDEHTFFNERSSPFTDQEKSLKNEPSNTVTKMMNDDSQLNTTKDHNLKESLQLKNFFFLTFKKEQMALEQDFFHLLFQKHKQESRISMFALIPIYLINTFLMIIIQNEIDNSQLILAFRGSYLVFLSLYLFFVMYHMKNSKWNRPLFYIIFFYGIISTLLFIKFTSKLLLQQVGLLEMIFIYLIFVNSNFLRFVEILILTSATFALWIIFYANNQILNEKNFFFILIVFIVNLFKINYQIRYHVQSFNTILINEAKKEEQNNLVSQLLPLHAFEKLKHVSVTNKIELTDNFENVTILFADIAGFTKYSSSVRPEDVVNMLRKLFTEFDKECLKHKVYKVYTIGDCYVVLGFLNANTRNPLEEAKNVVRMGFSMIDIISNVRQAINFPGLDMRIGVHTGEIIGGIIGTDIVRYDIYGKDVLIANKMESNGTEGKIMVSEATKKLLEKEEILPFRFEFKKAVECKVQIEPINSYLLYPKN